MLITLDQIQASSSHSRYRKAYKDLQVYLTTAEGEPLLRMILRAGKKFDLMHAFWPGPVMENPENLSFCLGILDRRYCSTSSLDCITYPIMNGVPRIAFAEKDWDKKNFLNYKERERYARGYEFTKHSVIFLDSLSAFIKAAHEYLNSTNRYY